jgi:hypothetical protein
LYLVGWINKKYRSLLPLPFFFGKAYHISVIIACGHAVGRFIFRVIAGGHAFRRFNFGVIGSLKIFCEMWDEDGPCEVFIFHPSCFFGWNMNIYQVC